MGQRLAQPLFGVDYTSRIDPGALKANGVRFAYRYVSRYSWKAITRAEADELKRNGIAICIVFEDGARNAWGGFGEGQADAVFAMNAVAQVGLPGCRITYAVDDATDGNPGATDGYFDGVAQARGSRIDGPYGGYEVVKHQADRGFQTLFQTYAWSGGALDTRAQVYQWSNDHNIWGSSVDFDHAYYDDFGQWGFNADPYAIFSASWFTFKKGRQGNGIVLKSTINVCERVEVKRADTLIPHPNVSNNRQQLHDTWIKLKLLRDRDWTVAHTDPATGRQTATANWGRNNLRERWNGINARMNKIRRLGVV